MRGPAAIFARYLACALALASVVLLPGAAWAQVGGDFFSVNLPVITSTTGFEMENESRVTRFTDIDEQTRTFSEEIEISTDGWAYHPGLAVFSIDLRPRLELETNKSTGTSKRTDRLVFFGYTIDTTFLQYKPYTLNIVSSRNRSTFNSSLAEDSETQTEIDRGTLLLKYEPLPTDISVERRVTEFQGFNNFRDRRLQARVDSRNLTDDSTTFITGEATRQERETDFSDFTVDRLLGSIRNSYRFDRNTRLSSTFLGIRTVSDQSTSRNLTGSEALYLQHTPDLSTDYQARIDHRVETSSFSRNLYGSARLRHQWYENLTTTWLNEVENQIFTGGKQRTYESDLDLRYRRPINWGRLELRNGYAIRAEENETSAEFIEVRDESIVLAATNLVFLRNINIELMTVVVTDVTGLIFYTEGPDYILTVVGETVAISRTGVGSAIADGATVLVDYRF